MAQLSISLLGGIEVTYDGEPVRAFGSDKARALLAFLAIESSRPHRRAELTGMFWPDSSEKKAAHNLSQTLLRLRQALREKDDPTRPAFLLVTPQDVQFNISSDYRLDVARFQELVRLSRNHNHPKSADCENCRQWLVEAAALYRGDLLAGLFVPDSVVFEEWRLVQQEELHRQAFGVLKRLADDHEQRGELELVQDYARRQISLEPWREEPHIQLIRALAQIGQSSAALKQYEIYRRTLAEELGLKPSAEVTRLYAQIRSGQVSQPSRLQPAAARPGEEIWIASQGERRQITILVCGLDAQKHGAAEDAEDVQERMAFCEQHCKGIFNRFGGQRALRQGDACLVCFGYPQAYEDAARRAVHSGLAIAGTLERSDSARIGIHTGMVIVGEDHGRGWQDRDLVGTALEIARDCQRQAGAGEVVITEETRRLVQEAFDLQPRSARKPGTADPSRQVYRVNGERSIPNRLDWLAQTQRLTQFAGREAELAWLKSLLERALTGNGQVILVSGDPGIGKSRLIWELKEGTPLIGQSTGDGLAKYPPVLWLSSRCLPRNQNTSLYPMVELLEGLLGFQAGDSVDIRQEKLAGVLAWYKLTHPSAAWLLSLFLGLPAATAVPESITQVQRERMRQMFIALLRKRAAEQPLVLVVEDLHWSDPSTLDWLGQSIGDLAAIPCLTLLTARTGCNPAWQANRDLHKLELLPLEAQEAGQLVSDLAGSNLLEDEIRGYIVKKTDGIPLFIEELTKTLVERPLSGGEKGIPAGIPATLLDTLAARLNYLGAAKETAQWAAVLGREFSYPILQSCIPYDEKRLQGDLARLIEAELVSPIKNTPQDNSQQYITRLRGAAPARYAFKHALMHEAVYTSLLKRTRQLYHRRVAEILAMQFPQIVETRPEVLAQHYSSAGMQTRAVECWLRAGERATVLGATLEARIFFDRAIGLIDPADYEMRWQALWGRETVLCYRGERAAQEADIAALLELAETLDNDTRRAQAQMRQARLASSMSNYRGQLQAAETAIAAAGRAGSIIVELEALAYKVTALMRLGERAELPQTVERTLAQADKAGNHHVRVYAMAAVALYYTESGALARAVTSLILCLDAARQAKVRQMDLESQYFGHLGFTYAQLGLYQPAREALEFGLELANLMGLGRYQAYHKLNLGFIHWKLGDLKTAIQMEAEALKEYSATGEAFGKAACQAYLGYIHEAGGDLALALQYLADARAGFEEIGVEADRFETQAVEARAALAVGRLQQARELAVGVWDFLRRQGTEGLGSPSLVYACLADVLETIEIPGISKEEVIETAYGELMKRAEIISEEEWRRSFLENVTENRVIVERWNRMNLNRIQGEYRNESPN